MEDEENVQPFNSALGTVGWKGKGIGKSPASGVLTPSQSGKGVGKRVGKGKGKFVASPTQVDERHNDASEYGNADSEADNMTYLGVTKVSGKKEPKSGKGKGKRVPNSKKSTPRKAPRDNLEFEMADTRNNLGRRSACRPSAKNLFDISEGEEDRNHPFDSPVESPNPTSLVPYSLGEDEDEVSSLPEKHDYSELDKSDISSEDEAEIRSPISFFDSDTSSLSSPPPSDISSSNESDLDETASVRSISSLSSSISLSSSDGDETDSDIDSDASLSELVPRPQNGAFPHYILSVGSPDTSEEDLHILAEEERFIIEEEEERIRNASSTALWSDDDEDDDDEDMVDELDNDVGVTEDVRNAMSGLVLDSKRSCNAMSDPETATQTAHPLLQQYGCASNVTRAAASFAHNSNTIPDAHPLPKLPGYHPKPSNLRDRTTASAPSSAPNSPSSLSKPLSHFPGHRRSMSSSATASPEAIAAALAAAATAAKAVAAASSKYSSSTVNSGSFTVPGCMQSKKTVATLPTDASTRASSLISPPMEMLLHGPSLTVALSDSTKEDAPELLRASGCADGGVNMGTDLFSNGKPTLPGSSDSCPPPASKRRRLSSSVSVTVEIRARTPTSLVRSTTPAENAKEPSTTLSMDADTELPTASQPERNSPPPTIPSINVIPCIELDEVVHTEQFYSQDDQFADFFDLSSALPLSPQQAAHVRALNRWDRIPIGTFRRSRRLSAPYLPAAAITAAVKPGKEKETVLWSAGAGAISDDDADSTADSTHHHRRRVHHHCLYGSSDEDDVSNSFDPSIHRAFHPRVRNPKRVRYRRRNRNPDMISGTLFDHEDAIAMMNDLGMDIGLGVGLGLDGLEEGMEMEIGMLLLQDCEEGEMDHGDYARQDDMHAHHYFNGGYGADTHDHTHGTNGYEWNNGTAMADSDFAGDGNLSGRRRKGQQSHVPPLPFVPSHLLSTLSLPKTMTVPVPYGMNVGETENVVGVGIGTGTMMSGFEDGDLANVERGNPCVEDGYGSSGDETVSEPPSPKLRAFQAAAAQAPRKQSTKTDYFSANTSRSSLDAFVSSIDGMADLSFFDPKAKEPSPRAKIVPKNDTESIRVG